MEESNQFEIERQLREEIGQYHIFIHPHTSVIDGGFTAEALRKIADAMDRLARQEHLVEA